MEIKLANGLFLSEHRASDAETVTEHMQAREISDQTLRVPYPYSRKNAEQFLGIVQAERAGLPRPANFAVRLPDGKPIGGIGIHDISLHWSRKGELGYWLAKPYWGQGIMTDAVKALCVYAHADWGLIRIEAGCWESNPASGRVLVKAGFQIEGVARALYIKNGVAMNSVRYSHILLK